LYAAKTEVRLVIDAPQLLGDQVPVAIRIKWCVGIDMDNRREAPVIGLVHIGIDGERALFQAPEFPHRYVVMNVAGEVLDRDLLRQIEHVPDIIHPGTGAHHHRLAADAALVGVECSDGPRVRAELEAEHRGAGQD
jgi:hypothetical protein